MQLRIDWGEPVFGENIILKIQPHNLDDFYAAASDHDKTNLLFMLLTSFHCCMDRMEQEKAAHLSFLIVYYLFVTLTPPGSYDLALHYISRAITLNPIEEYKEWFLLMEKGN